jgi:hypothetical protein
MCSRGGGFIWHEALSRTRAIFFPSGRDKSQLVRNLLKREVVIQADLFHHH